jgi:hypothetical protein
MRLTLRSCSHYHVRAPGSARGSWAHPVGTRTITILRLQAHKMGPGGALPARAAFGLTLTQSMYNYVRSGPIVVGAPLV